MPSLLVFDTDFLIRVTNDPLPKLDFSSLSSEYTLATTTSVVRELEGLSKRRSNTKLSRRAANALNVVRSGSKVRVLPALAGIGSSEADVELIEIAKAGAANEIVVATLDHSLLSRLERLNLSYLTLRRDRPLLRSSHRATHLSACD